MPLSEYEQRVLEQMERALTSDDPRLANTLQSSGRRSVLRYVLAGVGVVVGLLLLVVGVASSLTWVGVVGFVLMFAGVVFAVAAPRRKSGPAGVVDAEGKVVPPKPGKGKGKPSGKGGWSGFLTRLEERWDRRRDQGR
ncbi:DUF3040 domain-containing protein [Myceligenerans indicum]|uniref:DUF3040 domain-containing protein n=1 Tax=Myceligenerans indicum TaxID=2593663 RepID=A0ABS1LMG4_9MICO|nr:DUF3040 domain-containing protein [Myceligenerans indicum]MBL0887441.1 DUF3040 domain-containing protein [Myceligenerans indicum]